MGITRFLRNSAHSSYNYSLLGVLKDKVFAHSPHNLAELNAAIEMEFETLYVTPDFACCVCHILRNHCLACVAEGGSQLEHKISDGNIGDKYRYISIQKQNIDKYREKKKG